MQAVTRARCLGAWLLLAGVQAMSCSSHDVSLGESSSVRPTPQPMPQLVCSQMLGVCEAKVPGACQAGMWLDAVCDDAKLSCCILQAPTPTTMCELREGGVCIAPGDNCPGRIETDSTFACNAGQICCLAPIGLGHGGDSGGPVLPPGGFGGGG
jgi:hypothetical protein